MLALHGCYRQGFFLWGERPLPGDGREDARHPDGGSPCELGEGRIPHALAELGFEGAGSLVPAKLEIYLPSCAEKFPVPSTPLLGEIPRSRAKCSMRAWNVEAVSVSVTDLVALRPFLVSDEPVSRDGRFLANGVMSALDLCYIMECCSFVLSLLKRGRFLPDIRASKDKYEPVWVPMLIGDDSARYSRMMRVMPDIIKTRGESFASGPRTVLGEMISALVDGLVRHAWSRRIPDDRESVSSRAARAIVKKSRVSGESVPERRKRGRLVNALNPHALWIRSLGWFGETDGLSQSLGSIYSDVREWMGRYEWSRHAPYRLRLELSDSGDIWRLEYSLKCFDSGEIFKASDVWFGACAAGNPGAGGYMRRCMLQALGNAGSSFRPIRDSLEEASPSWCVLSSDDASEFLLRGAPDFAGAGIDIVYPSWWKDNASDMLTIRGARREGAGFRWRLAWKGIPLSDEEYKVIVRDRSPLSRIRGGWIFISPDHLEAVLNHIERLPETLSHIEAIRFAIKDPYVDGFDGIPELEATYEALAKGSSPDIFEAPAGMKGELRPYQERGFSWLAFLTKLGVGACLADDMGLGKTVQTLALVQYYRNTGHLRPVLLVCPTSVIENWRMEIERFFPGMSFYVHHGRDRFRGNMFAVTARRSAMVLSSYALIHRDYEEYRGVDWLGVVLDEAQNIKNPDTHQARAARGIKSDWRVVLTGTPVENHVGDIWSIMEFLMPGMLGSRKSFTGRYVKPLAESQDPRLTEGLRKSVSPFIMRRLKTDPDIVPELPRKIETKVFCGLKREQMRLYAKAAEEMSREAEGVEGIRRRGLVLAGITKMKRICDHPDLAERDGGIGVERSSKLERLLSLAEEMHETGDRALIFTQYVDMGHILKYQLQERFGREVLFLHGSVPRSARDGMVRQFQDGFGPQFFVLSLRAGGVGLNLTRANHVVMFDRWWNPAVENQAIDRAYRIGQSSSVQVHIFCCKGTLEERIDKIISSKRALAGSLIWEKDSWITDLSDRELQSLVALSSNALDS